MLKKSIALLVLAAMLSACASQASQAQYQDKTAEQQKAKILQCEQLKEKIRNRSSGTLKPSHTFNIAAYRQYKALGC